MDPVQTRYSTEWLALCDEWQAARAAEIAAFPTLGLAPTPEYADALESYLARKAGTQAVIMRMLDFMRAEAEAEAAARQRASRR